MSLDQNISEYTQRPPVLSDALGHPDVYLLQGKVPSAQELTPEVERSMREQRPAIKCQCLLQNLVFKNLQELNPQRKISECRESQELRDILASLSLLEMGGKGAGHNF